MFYIVNRQGIAFEPSPNEKWLQARIDARVYPEGSTVVHASECRYLTTKFVPEITAKRVAGGMRVAA